MLSKSSFRRIAQSVGRELEMALKDEYGINLDEFKQKLEGGLADKYEPEDFPVDQILKGIDVELEHVDCPYAAMEIAMDHLVEMDDYYDRLSEMEQEAEDE